jgi:streptogrisin C
MNANISRALCAATVVWLATASAVSTAQSTERTGFDRAVLEALQRDLGLTQQQATDRVAAERLATQRHPGLRQALGASYAGAWFDPAHSKLVVASTDPGAAKIALANGAKAVIVKRTLQQLNGVHERLDRTAAALSDVQKRRIWSWGVDVRTNSVVITVPAGDAQALIAAQDFIALGGADAKAVRIEQSSHGAPALYQTFRGGAEFKNVTDGGSLCSIGFSVTGGYVTAGHCSGGTVGDSIKGADNTAQGTFAGSTFPGEDRGWVQVNSNWTPSPCVGTVSYPLCYSPGNVMINGSTEAPINATVCRWGRTTGGPHCGTIQATNVTVNYVDGSTVNHLVQSTACSQPGDSGGPFVWNNQGQGMLSGGPVGGTCPTSTLSYYYPLNPALTAFGLTLAVAPPPPPTPSSISVTYTYSAGKYRFTATWGASAGATIYYLVGHSYNGPNTTVSWTVPENWEDLSTEYSVSACNAGGCSGQAGPVYAQ